MLLSKRETGRYSMSLPKFENFLLIPNSLSSQVLNRLATSEATHIPSLLY